MCLVGCSGRDRVYEGINGSEVRFNIPALLNLLSDKVDVGLARAWVSLNLSEGDAAGAESKIVRRVT